MKPLLKIWDSKIKAITKDLEECNIFLISHNNDIDMTDKLRTMLLNQITRLETELFQAKEIRDRIAATGE
jgi:hypothetical protein